MALSVFLIGSAGCDEFLVPEPSGEPIPGEIVYQPVFGVYSLRFVGVDSLAVTTTYTSDFSTVISKFILDVTSASRLMYPTRNGQYFLDLRGNSGIGWSTTSGIDILSGSEVQFTIPARDNIQLNWNGTGATYTSGDSLFALDFSTQQTQLVFASDSGRHLYDHAWTSAVVYFTMDTTDPIGGRLPFANDLYSISIGGGFPAKLTSSDGWVEQFRISGSLAAIQYRYKGGTRRLCILQSGTVAYAFMGGYSGIEISGDTIYYYGMADSNREHALLRHVWR